MTPPGPPDADPPARLTVAAIPLEYASPERRDRPVQWATLIVTVAVLLRLVFSATRGTTVQALAPLPDQFEYLDAATRILLGERMAVVSNEYGENLYAYRMPGYPVFVGACFRVRQLRAVRTAQALLDGTSVLAVYLVGRRLGGVAVAGVAASLVAFNPYLIYFSSLILSETLFTAFLAWGVVLLLRPGCAARAGGVVLLLASVYVRPSAIGLGVAAAAAVFSGGPTVLRGVGRAAAAGAVAAVGLVVLLLPWALRNRVAVGETIWTTTNSGYTAYDSFNPLADGSSNQAVFRWQRPLLVEGDTMSPRKVMGIVPPSKTPLADWQRERDLGEVGRSRQLSELAWQYARTHPRRAAELAWAKLGRFWSPVPLSDDYGGRLPYVIVGGLYAVPLFVLAAVGVWRGGLGRRATLILLLPALYFSAVHCVFVGSLRYRVPCDVPLAVLAAAGAVSLVRPKPVTA